MQVAIGTGNQGAFTHHFSETVSHACVYRCHQFAGQGQHLQEPPGAIHWIGPLKHGVGQPRQLPGHMAHDPLVPI